MPDARSATVPSVELYRHEGCPLVEQTREQLLSVLGGAADGTGAG